MSLALANLWGWILAHKRALLIAVGLIALLGLVLFTMDRCSTWREERSVRKDKEKIANTLGDIANRETVIANLQQQQAADKERVKIETADLLEKIEATNEAKTATNAALANLANARNGNAVNVSVEELERKLRQLDQ